MLLSGDTGNKFILLVDGDSERGAAVARSLESAGFEVVAASSERELRDCLARRRPDMILADAAMREIDGDLKSSPLEPGRVARPPLMLFNTRVTMEDIERGLGLGAVSALLAGDLPEHFPRAVRAAFERIELSDALN